MSGSEAGFLPPPPPDEPCLPRLCYAAAQKPPYAGSGGSRGMSSQSRLMLPCRCAYLTQMGAEAGSRAQMSDIDRPWHHGAPCAVVLTYAVTPVAMLMLAPSLFLHHHHRRHARSSPRAGVDADAGP